MRILFVGDIVGKSGRDVVSSLLFTLKKQNKADLVIANAENSAHGKGITYKIYNQLIQDGVDYITMGNHAFSKSEIIEHIDNMPSMVVPFNHEKRTCGNYYKIIQYKGIKLCLTNVLGEVFIGETSLSPYTTMDKVLDETKDKNIDFYFVDFHAEATAEKRIFAEYYKDKVAVVVGTHTHVQTADEQIIDGLAFISDVGMCGAFDSVIGRDIYESVNAKVNDEKTKYTVAKGPAIFCACLIEIDDKTKRATLIERIQIRP